MEVNRLRVKYNTDLREEEIVQDLKEDVRISSDTGNAL